MSPPAFPTNPVLYKPKPFKNTTHFRAWRHGDITSADFSFMLTKYTSGRWGTGRWVSWAVCDAISGALFKQPQRKMVAKDHLREPFPSVNLGLGTKQKSDKQLDAEKSWNTQTSSLDLFAGYINRRKPDINPSDHLSSKSPEVCIWNQL